MAYAALGLGLALALGAAASAAQQAPSCRVLDAELAQSYQGGCKNGLAHGQGVAVGLARYEGQFRKGMKFGQGVKTWPWGDRYEGGFVDDRKEGLGVYLWGEGSRWAGERYEGAFLADRRHGFGVYTWPNGDRYEGQWDQDQRLGYSVMEVRRNRAQAAQLAAFRPGVTVCRVGTAPGPGIIRGTVEALEGEMLTVRLSEVPPRLPGAAPGPPIAGDILAEEVVSWSPCL